MKTVFATAALALTLAAPAAAEVTNAEAFFAMGNSSAAELTVRETSIGNPVAAAEKFALTNMSAAERTVTFDRARNVDVEAIKVKFSLTNESPAERITN